MPIIKAGRYTLKKTPSAPSGGSSSPLYGEGGRTEIEFTTTAGSVKYSAIEFHTMTTAGAGFSLLFHVSGGDSYTIYDFDNATWYWPAGEERILVFDKDQNTSEDFAVWFNASFEVAMLLKPVTLVYTTDYSDGDSNTGLIVNTISETIEIKPVLFGETPTEEMLDALPDECKLTVADDGAYIMCIKSDHYGTSTATSGKELSPCYFTSKSSVRIEYSLAVRSNIDLAGGTRYPYLCVYDVSTDGYGVRFARFGDLLALFETSFGDGEYYTEEKMSPGEYVEFVISSDGDETETDEPEQEAKPTIISYNDAETSVNPGQIATICCSGKTMKGDVVITFGSAGVITYNGADTAIEAEKVVTFPCKDKLMESDIVISL